MQDSLNSFLCCYSVHVIYYRPVASVWSNTLLKSACCYMAMIENRFHPVGGQVITLRHHRMSYVAALCFDSIKKVHILNFPKY